MDEEQTTTEEKTETTEADTGKGSKYETTPIIERARQEREKLGIENDRKEKLLDREEAIMAKQALGGTTEAGQTKEVKEETDKEYSDRVDKEIREGKYNG